MTSLTKTEIVKLKNELPLRTQAFINGAFTDAIAAQKFESINPATGDVICAVSHCHGEDIDNAVKAARTSFESGTWSRSAPEDRKGVMLKLADLVRCHADVLSVMESIDSGKTITDCHHEISVEVASCFQWYAELIDKRFGKIASTGEEALALILKEPVGVAGLVVPWNFPLLMAAWKLAPALASGCSVVLKPAEETSLSALYLAELATEAGVPPGVLNITPGLGETAGEAIGRHPDIDVVSFTGSTEVGAYFMRYSGESNIKGVGLEMGGKSPFIVLDDAELNDDLIENAAMSAFWNGGENCSANMRQLIDVSLVDGFLERVVARAQQFRVGDPLDPETDIGPMVSQRHFDKVMSYIKRGGDEGARLVSGGSLTESSGLFIPPTVFTDLTPEMIISKDEIFGPVLGVLPIEGINHALTVAKDTSFGLHATVYTKDIDRAIFLSRRLPCGTVSVNGFSEGDIKTPFGGFKRSGSLARDNGEEALDQYLQTKTIWVNVGEVK